MDAESAEKMKSIVSKYSSDMRRKRVFLSYDNIPKILFFKAGEMYPPFKEELRKRLIELMSRKNELEKELHNLSNLHSKSSTELKQMRAELALIEAKTKAVSIDDQGEK